MPQSQNVGFQLLRLGLLNLALKGGGLAMITIGGVRWGLDRTWNMEHRTPPRRGQPNFVGCPRVPLSPTRTQTPRKVELVVCVFNSLPPSLLRRKYKHSRSNMNHPIVAHGAVRMRPPFGGTCSNDCRAWGVLRRAAVFAPRPKTTTKQHQADRTEDRSHPVVIRVYRIARRAVLPWGPGPVACRANCFGTKAFFCIRVGRGNPQRR